jgi:DNA-binding transcriptional regulator YiaG
MKTEAELFREEIIFLETELRITRKRIASYLHAPPRLLDDWATGRFRPPEWSARKMRERLEALAGKARLKAA